ncbi:MAG: pentapeptide repeat-containing protein [Nitrospirae bacterium]|nr:pentapeptide repeat-containing protein [Nitrospirota bacterium]
MKPKFSNDPMYQLLRDGNITEFNARFEGGEKPDLSNCDFRNVDLRGLEVTKMDFSGSYFRQADLRGLDLSDCKLEGVSIHGAQISGILFPKELSAQEILLSHQQGTRMRYGV